MSSRRAAGRDPLDSITIHIGDWRTSSTVARLGRYLESAYLELLMHQWLSEGDGLPADEEEIRTMLRLTPAEWAKFWRVAGPKFSVDDDGKRRNRRTHVEWQYCHETRDKVRTRASSGGRAKAAQAGAQAGAQALPKQRPGIAPSPAPSPSSPDGEEARATPPLPLLEKFADPRHQDAYRRARLSARVPAALDATLEMMADGAAGPGGKPCSWHQLGGAILEAQAAGRDMSAQTLRNFAAKIDREPVRPPIALWSEEPPPATTWSAA